MPSIQFSSNRTTSQGYDAYHPYGIQQHTIRNRPVGGYPAYRSSSMLPGAGSASPRWDALTGSQHDDMLRVNQVPKRFFDAVQHEPLSRPGDQMRAIQERALTSRGQQPSAYAESLYQQIARPIRQGFNDANNVHGQRIGPIGTEATDSLAPIGAYASGAGLQRARNDSGLGGRLGWSPERGQHMASPMMPQTGTGYHEVPRRDYAMANPPRLSSSWGPSSENLSAKDVQDAMTRALYGHHLVPSERQALVSKYGTDLPGLLSMGPAAQEAARKARAKEFITARAQGKTAERDLRLAMRRGMSPAQALLARSMQGGGQDLGVLKQAALLGIPAAVQLAGNEGLAEGRMAEADLRRAQAAEALHNAEKPHLSPHEAAMVDIVGRGVAGGAIDPAQASRYIAALMGETAGDNGRPAQELPSLTAPGATPADGAVDDGSDLGLTPDEHREVIARAGKNEALTAYAKEKNWPLWKTEKVLAAHGQSWAGRLWSDITPWSVPVPALPEDKRPPAPKGLWESLSDWSNASTTPDAPMPVQPPKGTRKKYAVPYVSPSPSRSWMPNLEQ